MRVGTKLYAGFALAVLPLAALVALLTGQFNRLADDHHRLNVTQFSAAVLGLKVLRRLDTIEEYARKFGVSGDSGYAAKITETRSELGRDVKKLGTMPMGAPARRALLAMQAGLPEARTALDALVAAPEQPSSAVRAATANRISRRDTLAGVLTRLAALRHRGQGMLEAIRTSIAAQVKRAGHLSAQTVRLSWGGVLATVAISLALLFVAQRTIGRPLKRLISGTREVSSGSLSVRVKARGSDELAELSRTFNAMVADLARLEQSRSEFISRVSHDLKTPLASMIETNRLLLDELPGPLTRKQRRLIELSLDATRRLSTMIGDLLDLSRLQGGARFEIEAHDICRLAERAVAEFEARALERRVVLETRLPNEAVTVWCDRKRLLQAIHNLVDNTLKVTPRGGAICVAVRTMDGNNDARGRVCEVVVTDSGPGVAEGDRERIFNKFYQGGPYGKRGTGVGLGLAICREIIAGHHGQIWVADARPHGAAFHIRLPFAPPQLPEAQPA